MMRSGVGQSMMGSQMSSMVSDASDKPSVTNTQVEVEEKVTRKAEKLTKEELEKEVEIVLEETETITTFKLFGQAAQEGKLILFSRFSKTISETENIEAIKEKNDAYETLCANREGNDKYVSSGMQTFNNKLKDKQTLTAPITKNSQASQGMGVFC